MKLHDAMVCFVIYFSWFCFLLMMIFLVSSLVANKLKNVEKDDCH